jgi:hypothetical protein
MKFMKPFLHEPFVCFESFVYFVFKFTPREFSPHPLSLGKFSLLRELGSAMAQADMEAGRRFRK